MVDASVHAINWGRIKQVPFNGNIFFCNPPATVKTVAVLTIEKP